MIDKFEVFLDLDGVMADFEGALQDKLGIDFSNKGRMWGKIQHHDSNVEPWFYSLPVMSDANVLWEFVSSNFSNVQVLSASGTTPRDAAGQKKAWFGDHFGYDTKVNIVGSSSEKAAFAHSNAILIDDRSRAIDPFIAAGGIGVLHTSAANTIATLKVMMEGWE